jgi:hypothetical protein
MRRTAVVVVAAGLLIGAAAGYFVHRAIDDPAATPSTSAPAVTEPQPETPVWSSAFETRIGPAVVVAESLEYSDGILALTYDVVPIGPASAETFGFVPAAGAMAAPRDWELAAGGTVYAASVVGPSNRTIRFSVGDGFGLEDIDEVRILSYQVLSPVRFPWDVARDDPC